MDGAVSPAALLQCHSECGNRVVMAHVVGYRPANYLLRVGVRYEEQVMKALPIAKPYIGDVRDPQLVDAAGLEVPAQIRIHPQAMVGECSPRTVNALLYKQILFSQKRKQGVSADIDAIVTFQDML